MAPPSARDVQHRGAVREGEQLADRVGLFRCSFRAEQRPVDPQEDLVEILGPPLGGALAHLPLTQKKTGSRYAPKTSSIACRISYSVAYARTASSSEGTTFSP